jgi:hypothetical protein
MRNPFLSPPRPEELEALEVHELIRDYPELLPLFRQSGIRVREDGTNLLPAGSLPGMGEEGGSFGSLDWRRLDGRQEEGA